MNRPDRHRRVLSEDEGKLGRNLKDHLAWHHGSESVECPGQEA